jgi:LysR family cys regulon transcriptional activator
MTLVAIRSGIFLPSFAYRFIEMFAPTLKLDDLKVS